MVNKRKKEKRERINKDKEWAKLVKTRDNYTCQVCKKQGKNQGINAHHIIPRIVKELRHDLKNGITLCPSCHRWGKNSAHQNAIFFSEWLKENKFEIFKYLREKIK